MNKPLSIKSSESTIKINLVENKIYWMCAGSTPDEAKASYKRQFKIEPPVTIIIPSGDYLNFFMPVPGGAE
jgi:hypothetical protein